MPPPCSFFLYVLGSKFPWSYMARTLTREWIFWSWQHDKTYPLPPFRDFVFTSMMIIIACFYYSPWFFSEKMPIFAMVILFFCTSQLASFADRDGQTMKKSKWCIWISVSLLSIGVLFALFLNVSEIFVHAIPRTWPHFFKPLRANFRHRHSRNHVGIFPIRVFLVPLRSHMNTFDTFFIFVHTIEEQSYVFSNLQWQTSTTDKAGTMHIVQSAFLFPLLSHMAPIGGHFIFHQHHFQDTTSCF